MKLIRKIGKRILSSSLLRNYWYEYDAKLAKHIVSIADTRITFSAPKRVVEMYNNDTREGKLTGVDKAGRYEHSFAMRFRDFIRPDTIVFDVGAHYGLYSILAFQIMKPAKPGQIVSFEPNPFNAWVLRHNNHVYCKSYLTIENRKIGDITQKKNSHWILIIRKQELHPHWSKWILKDLSILPFKVWSEFAKK
jgi:hypothetical protein